MILLMYMAPVAVAVLLPAAIFMERDVVGIAIALARDDLRFIFYLIFNSSLAYLVNLTNFLVTKHTSALTLQVFLPILCMNFLRFIDKSSMIVNFCFLPYVLPSNQTFYFLLLVPLLSKYCNNCWKYIIKKFGNACTYMLVLIYLFYLYASL